MVTGGRKYGEAAALLSRCSIAAASYVTRCGNRLWRKRAVVEEFRFIFGLFSFAKDSQAKAFKVRTGNFRLESERDCSSAGSALHRSCASQLTEALPSSEKRE